MSVAAKNRKLTEEGRKKLSISRKGRVSKIKKQIKSNGVIYSSLKEASIILKISRTAISNCLAGRAKTAGNRKWEYVNNPRGNGLLLRK